jgi:hypothetical protein
MDYLEPCVFASYYNSSPDPQRKGLVWQSDVSQVMPLISSVVEKNRNIKIFHDCFIHTPKIERCEWIKVSDDLTGQFTASALRWIRYLNYLKTLSVLPRSIFMVDSTDVIMLNDPFDQIESNKIYCGDESAKVENPWMRNREKRFEAPDYRQIIESAANEQLLNAGVCGGHIEICLEFLELLSNYHFQYNLISKDKVSVDMPAFNYTLWKHFRDRLIHGHPVNTRFKKEEFDMSKWWKHK